MHSSYIPQSSSRSSSRRHVQSFTPSRNRARPKASAAAPMHRRRLSNPAALARPVTPTDAVNMSFNTAPSWTDSPRSMPLPHNVPPEVVLGHSRGASGSVVSEMGRSVEAPNNNLLDEDMPMDELQHTARRVSPVVLNDMRRQVKDSQKEVERLTALLKGNSQSRASMDAADRGGGVAAAHLADDVSSLGDDDDSPKLTRLVHVIQDPNPTGLSSEEKAVWDVVQSNLNAVRTEAANRRREVEQQLEKSTSELAQARSQEKKLEQQLDETTQELEALKAQVASQKDTERKSLELEQEEKAQQAMKLRRLEDQLAEMETKYKEAHELAETQQEEHDRAICAIQRVLADVTSERDKAIEELQEKLYAAQEAAPAPENGAKSPELVESPSTIERAHRAAQLERDMESLKSILQRTEQERDTLKQDLDQKGGKIVILEQELKVVKTSLEKNGAKDEDLAKKLEEKTQDVVRLEGELAAAKHQVETLTKREEELTAEQETTKKEIYKLRRMQRLKRGGGDNETLSPRSTSSTATANSKSPTNEVAALQEQLAETQASLENAKKIILSLETASGTLAVDLRGKLKDKEEKVQDLQTEATDRKRALDSLATELRDLQRRKGEMDRMDHWSKNHIRKQRVLSMQLESSLNELQSAAVVYEASMESGTSDQDTLDKISKLLGNTLAALKYASTDLSESEYLKQVASFDDDKSVKSGVSDSSRRELEERKIQVNKLEESLKNCKEELDMMRRESTQIQLRCEEQETRLRSEILMLREQCQTNMEVLAKKERELEVLRDSLDVGDEGVGYISDDEDDDEDEEDDVTSRPPMSPTPYGHSQAEALATLMANGSGLDGGAEVDTLRRELKKASLEKDHVSKELKGERESLANAKMIISSLERANKSMMEDLRQRLQDSNTAIASLLDKSTQSEKQSTSLREELEQLKKEREEEAKKHQEELNKLKDEGLVHALRLAAKDREIQELLQKTGASKEEPAEESKQDS